MEQQLTQISEQQKDSWNKFSQGWKKWDDLMMDFLRPMGRKIIQFLDVKDGDKVLDVAAGTGEPGLTIAGKIPNGKVIITDLSEGMLKVAMENAEKKGLTNVETMVCDVSELPFEDNTFDAVSCRFGFMFFPDMLIAARELVRVLKPGGKFATTVWNVPEKNFWVTAIMGTISKNMELPPPPPGAPGMFRCAKSGAIVELFKEAGLINLTEEEVTGQLKAGTADTYWNMMTEVGAPIVAALAKADDKLQEKIKQEVYEAVHQKYEEGNVNIEASALLISGEK